MDCDLCDSRTSSESGLCCPSCARAALYPIRIQHAQTLLEKERLGQRIEQVVQQPKILDKYKSIEGKNGDTNTARQYSYDNLLGAVADSKSRIEQIAAKAGTLQKRIDEYKQELAAKRVALKNRRESIETSRKLLAEQCSTSLESAQKRIAKTGGRHEAVYSRIIASRTFLCREVGSIASLEQHRRKAQDGSMEELYTLGGQPIIDLINLNTAQPRQVTTCLTNVSRLLALVCNYLDVRLPAEVTIPHVGYPLPTIFPPSGSYTGRQVPFPGGSSSSSPSSSRMLENRDQPRPRPLFLDRKLPVLAKEDSAAYSLFIEGVAFLAWDIAWLCRTQGLAIASTDWEELCAIGRNLWALLIATPKEPRPALRRNTTSKDVDIAGQGEGARPDSANQNTRKTLPTSLGVYSHGTSFAFLGSPGSPYSRSADTSTSSWRFASPTLFVDKLRNALQSEMYSNEWELLDPNDWRGMDGAGDDQMVLIGDGQSSMRSVAASTFVADSKTSDSQAAVEREEAPIIDRNGEIRAKGTSGWTKLKSRAPTD